MTISEDNASRHRCNVENLAANVAELCSALVGEPRWPNSWSCIGWYWADIRDVGGFRVLVEDVEGSGSDALGFETFTARHIKVFADDMLLIYAYTKMQGLDEYDGGRYGDRRVDFVRDGWHIASAPWNDEPCAQALQEFSEQLNSNEQVSDTGHGTPTGNGK